MAHVFQTPIMGRKGSYNLSEGRNSVTPVNVDILNDHSGKSQGAGDPESGRQAVQRMRTILIFIALVLVIILLIAAIVWLLTTRNGKAVPQDDESPDQSARRGGAVTQGTTTTTTTRRPTRIIDPGTKPSRSSTLSSSTATTPKTTTTTESEDEDFDVGRKSDKQPWPVQPTENLTTRDPVFDYEATDSETEYLSSSTEFTQTETISSTTKESRFTPMIYASPTDDYGLPEEGSGTSTGTFDSETSTTLSASILETTTEADIAVIYSITESETATSGDPTQLSSPFATSAAASSSTADLTSPQTDTERSEREGLATPVDETYFSSKLSSVSERSTSTTTETASERSHYAASTTEEYDEPVTRSKSITHESYSTTESSSYAAKEDEYFAPVEGSGAVEATESTTSTETSPTSRLGVAETDGTRPAVTEDSDFSTMDEVIFATTPEPPTEETCWTEECQVLASQMRSVMNTNENPCENFYQYSCGRIGSRSSLFETSPIDLVQDVNRRIAQAIRQIDSESPRPLKMFQTFYKQCLSGAGEPTDPKIELVRNAVQEIGQFETGENYDSSTFDLTKLIGELILRHSSPVFDVILDVDKHNTSKFAFKIGPWEHHGSLLGHTTHEVEHCMSLAKSGSTRDEVIVLDDLYSNYINCLDDLNIRLNRIEEALETLGFFTDIETSTRRQLVSALRFSAEYDVLQPVRDERPSAAEFRQTLLAKQYTEYTVRDLYKQFPGIDWKRLFFILTKVETPEDETVQVYFPNYLKKKLKPVAKVNSESYKIQNVLLALYASDLFHDLAHFERHNEQGCQELAVNWMEDIASTLYLSTFTVEERDSNLATLTEMFNDLKDTLIKQVSSVSWEDPTLSTTLLNKAQAVNADFENSMHLLKQLNLLESRWEDVQLGADFVSSSLSLLKRYRRSLYVMKGVDPGSKESIWSLFSLPTVTAGRTMYTLNRILIPMGSIASGQLMNSNFPLYVNMAKIGMLMAHEIMHNFDPAGIQFSPGSLSVKNSAQYDKTFSCMASKTGKTDFVPAKDKHVTFRINNDLTMNERYSDAAGIALALETYRRRKDRDDHKGQIQLLPYLNMTDSQLFFVSTAQVFCSLKGLEESAIDVAEREHLHPELRIRELVRSSAEFREAFQCREKPNKLTDEAACPVFPFFHR